MKLRREKKKCLRSQIVKREWMCVLSGELSVHLHWKGKYYLKGSACASQGIAAGAWVSLEELLMQGAAVCGEASGSGSPCLNTLGTGCKSGTSLVPVPWEVPACGPGSSEVSGSFVICCLVTNNANESARHGAA